MIRKFSVLTLFALLALTLSSSTAYSATKAGAKCTKIGIKSTFGNKTFTCIKSGKKLVWSKGVTVSSTTNSNEALIGDLTPVSAFLDKSFCQLKQNYQNFFYTGFGFPRSEKRLSNKGDVNGIMVFVEFNDVKGSDNPLIEGKKFTTKFEEFYRCSISILFCLAVSFFLTSRFSPIHLTCLINVNQ